MRVVVLGLNVAGSRSHYVTGTMVRVYLVGCRLSLFPIGAISYAMGYSVIRMYNYLS